MSSTTEQGTATTDTAAWLADDPASSLRLALDMLDGNSARQTEPLLRWALGHLRGTVVFREADGWVTSASFSPDGLLVLAASLDHTVRVFQAADGEQLASFDIGAVPRFLSGKPKFSSDGTQLIVPGFDGLLHIGPWQGAHELPVVPVSAEFRVTRAALARDNRTLITGHANGTVRMSLLGAPGEPVPLAGTLGDDPIACVAVSPDARYAAAGTRTGALWLWDLARPGRPVMPPPHEGYVNTVKFSHDSRLLASASDDFRARIFSVPEGRLVADLRTHTDRVNDATFSHHDDLLVTAGVDKTARVSDTRTGDERVVLRGVADEVQSAEFSPDDRLVAMASVDGTGQICYAHNGRPLFRLTEHRGAVFTIAFDPAGTRVVTASADRTARVSDVDLGQVFWDHEAQVNTAVFGLDGRIIASAGEDGTVRVSETAGGKQIALLASHDGGVNSAAFNFDSTLLVTAGQDATARVTAWQTADPPIVLRQDLEVDAALFTPDGNRVITCTRREATLIDWRTGEHVMTFAPPPDERAANPFIAMVGVDISHDSRILVTAHYDEKARVWDAATGAQLRSLPHAGVVYTAVFGDDGKVLTASGGDGHARLWDAETGELVHLLAGPSRQLRCAALSPDGRWAAAGDPVGRMTLWSVADERVAAVWQQHTDLIMAAAFSPDSEAIATAGDDGTVRVVAIGSLRPLDEPVSMARQRLRSAAP